MYFSCSNMFVNPYQRFLPNYLSTFIPILFVMIANPYLYFTSFSTVGKLLPMSTGRLAFKHLYFIYIRSKYFLAISIPLSKEDGNEYLRGQSFKVRNPTINSAVT